MGVCMHVHVCIFTYKRRHSLSDMRPVSTLCQGEISVAIARAHRKETGIKPKAVGYQVTTWWLGACPRG